MIKIIIKIKAILSLLLLLIFIIVACTGIGLQISPSERIAKETHWSFFGLNKLQLENMHTIFGYIMSALIIIHLIINYKIFLAEIKTLFKK